MPFPDTSFDPRKRAGGAFAILEFQKADRLLAKVVLVVLVEIFQYSARKKLINSSAGKPVNSEHPASTAVFSGVSATAVFMD